MTDAAAARPDTASVGDADYDSGADAVDRLIVAWQHPDTRAISPIGVLGKAGDGFEFEYLPSAAHLTGFRPLLGFPEVTERYESARLFPLFRQRLMDRRRPDYERYVGDLGLTMRAAPLTVLGRSGGRRAGDTLFFFERPQISSDDHARATFFVHGIRHQAGAIEHVATLHPGVDLVLEPEPDNPVNDRAVLVTTADGRRLGWVPDLLAELVQNMLSTDAPRARVVRINDTETPPNLRLLVDIAGRVTADRAPFDDELWRQLAR